MKTKLTRPWLIILAAGTALAATVVTVAWLSSRAADRPPTVDFFDIGQGDSIMIRHGWQEALIDGGPDRSVMAKLGRSLPYLDRTVETVFATHPHDDHIKGLLPVMDRYQVGQLVIPKALADDPAQAPLLAAAVSHQVKVVQAVAGDRFQVGQVSLTVLWPPADCLTQLAERDFDVSQHDPLNICSLVLRLDHCDSAGCRRALLMADATSESEAIMAERGLVVPADLLKVGHHGSRFASTADFIQAVRPRDAVIQVGQNHFGHPNLGVLLRLRSVGTQVWRNDLDGDIRAIPSPAGFEVFPR